MILMINLTTSQKKYAQLITNNFYYVNEKLNNLNLRIKHPEYYIRENYQ